ncbi:MAG: aspartyl protease family protein [Phycisphaerae bacterium]|nr:aspartyl protease family protein [Phycisphaerae bacterium]MDD5381822.1 aspartyl protease family protein [Phycisphaerae bacterium]
MSDNKGLLCRKNFVLLFIAVLCWIPAVEAKKPDWQRQPVNWRMTGGSSIKAVNYPQEKTPPMFGKRKGRRPASLHKKVLPAEAAFRLAPLAKKTPASMIALVIDSPPVDGFVPWIAVAVTNERFNEDDLRFDAVPIDFVSGSYLTPNPESDYAVGIFDTGASAHIISHAAASQAGLSGPYLTSNTVEVSGVTGSVFAWVSYPLGIFIDGLGAIEPDGMLYDTSGMVGETNVSVVVGDAFDSPNLPTAIGSPLSVYFAADFHNDRQITISHGSEDFTGPDISFYELSDPCCPTYSNKIPLELRPLGGIDVEYIPYIDPFNPFELPPASPSIIIGNLSQSIFFVHSVDLYEGSKSAIDKDRFMLDTGAQVTVVGSRVAARLGLNPANPAFEVEIQGVTGDIIMAPGFYIDSIDIPALGEWLSFTDIPVILLDVASPEGGTADGIIGMNLFVELNFVLRGGGLLGLDDPSIEFALMPLIADIAPPGGDHKVDFLDLAELASHWLQTPSSPDWNSQCDLAPTSSPDGIVNFLDFAVLANHWLESVEL